MRLKSFFFAIALMLLALTQTVSAQDRTLGARRFLLDDGTNTLAGLSYITTNGGSVGIDNLSALPNLCALLDLQSTTKGFLTPRMTAVQESNICSGTPPEGLIAYNLTTHTLDIYNGSGWGAIGGGWALRGNSIISGGTAPGGSYIGTNNAQDFVVATNGIERARILGGANAGRLGLGTISPNRLLEVAGAPGTPSARFGSLSGAPLLAPPINPATDGFVMGDVNGDISKYDISTAVSVVGWLRTGNTILDGNNKLGSLNDIAVNLVENNATIMTIGNVAQGQNVGIRTAPLSTWALTVGTSGSNSLRTLGNTQVDAAFTSAGNSTVGTGSATTNTFGNGGGATTNTIGNNATGGNNLGNATAAVTMTNTIGASNAVGANVTTNIGQPAAGASATTNIGAVVGGGSAINVQGVTQINASAAATTSIGNTGAGGAVTISSANPNPITIDVGNVANNLTLNNIAAGANTDAAFLDLTTIPNGSVRTRTIQSMVTGSNGVEVTYPNNSVADAHFAGANNLVIFGTPRFVNTGAQSLSLTGNSGGVGTTFASFNGTNDAIGLNNVSTNNGTTTIGNTTAGANVQINSAGSGNSAVNTISLNGTTNINTGATQSRTTIGNGAGASTQLDVNGVAGSLVGLAPYTNGPDNGWDLYVAGDEQITNILKIGTASIIVDPSNNSITGYNANGLTLNTSNSGGVGDLILRANNTTVATGKGTGPLVGSLDLPTTIASGPGIITMSGTRYIHAFGTSNFFAGANAGNFTMTGASNVGVGQGDLQANTTGSQNAALGVGALGSNTTGGANTATGYTALQLNTTGSGNTANGGSALFNNIAGVQNTAVGLNAMFNNNGNNNVGVGVNSAVANTTGSGNTALGAFSLGTNTTGSNNTALGTNADVTAVGLTNATAIGANAKVAQSNSIVLGDITAPTSVGIGINAPTTILDVRGSTNILGATTLNTLGFNLTTMGNSTSHQWFRLNGAPDAVVGDLIGNAHWDLAVDGDIFASGMINAATATITSLTPGSVVFAGTGGALSQNNPQFFWNNASSILDLGTNVTNAVATKLQVSNNENPANGDAHQVIITGTGASANQMLELGYNTTGNNGSIQSINQGVGATNLVVQPAGGRTIIGNATSGAISRAEINGATGDLVGAAPYSNGPDNGWDLWVSGDAQVTNILKIGTASMIADPSNNTFTGYNASGLTLAAATSDLTIKANGNTVATAKAAGNLDIPTTTGPAIGVGTITQNGVRFIHSFGGSNFFAGANAGNGSMTGIQNTAVGPGDLQSNTSGMQNAALGTAALAFNTTGSGNTATGYTALQLNTSGGSNTANGGSALFFNTTGGQNTASGVNSLFSNNGNNNTASGVGSLSGNTSGNDNTAVGFSAGVANTVGIENTFIGSGANASANNLTNATAIGWNSTVATSNAIVLGNTGASTKVGIGINNPASILDVAGSTNIAGTTTINTGLANLTSIGNSAAVTGQRLLVNGLVDAVAADALGNAHWDLQDNGDLIVGGMTKTNSLVLSPFTPGSVLFIGTGGQLTQDNANFFWDNVNKRLGIGNAAPLYQLDVTGTSHFSGAVLADNTLTVTALFTANGGSVLNAGATVNGGATINNGTTLNNLTTSATDDWVTTAPNNTGGVIHTRQISQLPFPGGHIPITSQALAGPYNINALNDYLIICVNAVNGNVNLPAPAANPGKVYVVKKAGAGNVTVGGGGGNIDGAAVFVLNAANQVTAFTSDGANWWIISN